MKFENKLKGKHFEMTKAEIISKCIAMYVVPRVDQNDILLQVCGGVVVYWSIHLTLTLRDRV